MKKITITLITLLTLNGCAAVADSLLNPNKDLYELNGSPINYVIAKMGYPDNQYELGKSKVYIWRNQRSGPDVFYGGTRTTTCEVKMVASTNYGENTYIVRRVEIGGDENVCPSIR